MIFLILCGFLKIILGIAFLLKGHEYNIPAFYSTGIGAIIMGICLILFLLELVNSHPTNSNRLDS